MKPVMRRVKGLSKTYDIVEDEAGKIDWAQTQWRRAESASVLAIGMCLLKAQTKLANYGNGVFIKWMKQRLEIPKSTGYRWMRVAAVFGHFQADAKLIDLSALYELSKPSIPRKALEECIAIARSGGRVTRFRARFMIESELAKRRGEFDLDPDDDEKGENAGNDGGGQNGGGGTRRKGRGDDDAKQEHGTSPVDRIKMEWEECTRDEKREVVRFIRGQARIREGIRHRYYDSTLEEQAARGGDIG